MPSNSFIEISKTYFGKPDSYFMKRRNQRVSEDNRSMPITEKQRRWDCEWPEYHQAQVDPKQEIYWGFHYDTMHDDYGELEYKNFAKSGVKLSEFTQKQIRAGKVKYIVVWRWFNNNKWAELKEDTSNSYEIMGLVEANYALTLIDNDGRFPYPPPASLDEFF